MTRWMLMLAAVLLAACGDSDETAPRLVAPSDSCTLDVAIAPPDRLVTSRADEGSIGAGTDESTVHTLKVWVFRHDNGEKLSYVSYGEGSENVNRLNSDKKLTAQLKIPASFADVPVPVDIYAVANEASCALTLIEGSTRSTLDGATIGSGNFGTSSEGAGVLPKDAVPDAGLPMSAVVKGVTPTGSFPTMRVGTGDDETSALRLTRAVSRLRFVICQISKDKNTKKELTSIDQITLDKEMIPTAINLIPPTVSFSYASGDQQNFISSSGGLSSGKIPTVADPRYYAFDTQVAQDYETLLDNLVAGNVEGKSGDKALQLGPYYFRESPKQLTGTVSYHYKDNDGANSTTETIVPFSMAAPGDFLRNHSWIVYIYYMDEKIHVFTVSAIGMRKWTEDEKEESTFVYNW